MNLISKRDLTEDLSNSLNIVYDDDDENHFFDWITNWFLYINMFYFENWLFSIVELLQKWLAHTAGKHIEKLSESHNFRYRKTPTLSYTLLISQGYKSAFVNGALPSLHVSLLVSTLSFNLKTDNLYLSTKLSQIFQNHHQMIHI